MSEENQNNKKQKPIRGFKGRFRKIPYLLAGLSLGVLSTLGTQVAGRIHHNMTNTKMYKTEVATQIGNVEIPEGTYAIVDHTLKHQIPTEVKILDNERNKKEIVKVYLVNPYTKDTKEITIPFSEIEENSAFTDYGEIETEKLNSLSEIGALNADFTSETGETIPQGSIVGYSLEGFKDGSGYNKVEILYPNADKIVTIENVPESIIDPVTYNIVLPAGTQVNILGGKATLEEDTPAGADLSFKGEEGNVRVHFGNGSEAIVSTDKAQPPEENGFEVAQ